MPLHSLAQATQFITELSPVRRMGRLARLDAGTVLAHGFGSAIRIGDRVEMRLSSANIVPGEVIQIAEQGALVLPEGPLEGGALGDDVVLIGPCSIAPDDSWIGRVVSPDGVALDGKPLAKGMLRRALRAAPPPPTDRAALGKRLETGLCTFNTMLPIVDGQRLGLFAGSGVGKSTLLGELARSLEADVVVIAMVGERGREVRHFVDEVLGPDGLARSVVVAATSDKSALQRRRCAWTAMAVAEHFRDQGKSVLFLADSITRFAEAHREISVAAGEAPVLRGYPPSTAHMIMSLCERAGPGVSGQGAITGLFSVLVAGSDMDEPVADILRGVLDGHIVLDREIAERGRFPAVDILRSVSRSLPAAASAKENEIIQSTRRILSTYDRNITMITAGLYAPGSDPDVDTAIKAWPDIEDFLAAREGKSTGASFNRLELILRRAKAQGARVGSVQRRDVA